MNYVKPPEQDPRLSPESIAVRAAMGAAIGGAALTSLVVGIPGVIICAALITAGATYFVLK